MERALQLVVELLQVVVAATIGLVVLVMFLSPFFPRPHRPNSNEHAAVANLRTINTAEVTYLSSSGGNFGDLPALVAAGLLDDTFIGTATHPKAGYIYNITTTGSDYTATADPASTNTGRFGYCSHPDAVSLFNERFASSSRSVRTIRPVGASSSFQFTQQFVITL
jgi:hypothetical protein